MGNLTKEQLEKRLDEVLAELDTERIQRRSLEINLESARTELETVRQTVAAKEKYADEALKKALENAKLIEQRDETINNLRAALYRSTPAPVDTEHEALIREKVRAGLSRKQAEEVIKAQEAEDARRAEAEEDED